jgi:hypothetical protein
MVTQSLSMRRVQIGKKLGILPGSMAYFDESAP